MSEVYGAGSGISQGITDLHNMASTGLVTAQAQQTQMALEQQRQAMEVTRNYLARIGQGQAQPQAQAPQAPQAPFGVAPPSAFGPQPTPGSVSIQPLDERGVPIPPQFGQPGPLGSPGGQADPVQQVQPDPQALVQAGQPGQPQQPSITDFFDGLSQEYMKAGLVDKASELATHSADLKHKANLAASEAAQAKVRQLEVTAKHMEMVGRFAKTAIEATGGKETPLTFPLFQHMAIQQDPSLANDPEFVNHPYVPGQLTFYAKNGIELSKQVELEQKKVRDDWLNKATDAEIDSAKTRADLNREEIKQKRAETDFMLKHDGLSYKQYGASMAKLGPGVKTIAEYYKTNPENLTGIDTKEKQVIEASHASIQNTEDIAQFIDTHPKAAGTLAAALQRIGKPTFNILDNMAKKGKSDAEIANEFFAKADLTGDAAILAKKLVVQALNDVQGTAGGRMNMYLEKTFAQDIYNQSLSPKTLKRVLADRQETAARTLKQFGIDVNKAPEGELKFYRGSGDHQKAIEWAKANPNDPDAKAFLEHIGK